MLKKFYLLMNEAGDDSTGGGGSGGDNQGSGSTDNTKTQGDGQGSGNSTMSLEDAQKIIKELRAENAKHRTEKNNLSTRLEKIEKGLKLVSGDGEDDETAEVKLGKLEPKIQSLEVRNAMYELAIEHSISKADFEYFEFLMSKKFDSLEEGQEMTEEDLEAILGQLKSRSQKAPANTSAGTGTKPDNASGKDGVTLEQFVKMGMMEKSKLYQTKPDLYASLLSEARNKKLL